MNQFVSRDFSLCAFLISCGYRLASIERDGSARAAFCFERDLNLEEAVQLFWAKQARVEPMALFQASRELKARLHSQEAA